MAVINYKVKEMPLKSRALIESGQSFSKNKLTYCEVGQIYKVELIITELRNTTDTDFHLVAFVNSADVNNSSNEN